MRLALAAVIGLVISVPVEGRPGPEPEPITLATEDGGSVHAHAYGNGAHGVVLAHGGRFDKESWSVQAMKLAALGFRVLAIDFRGYGESHGPGDVDPLGAPLHLDVLAAARYLRSEGASQVSVIGASMGADAAAGASAVAEGEIDRLVLLAGGSYAPVESVKSRVLFIVGGGDLDARGTPRLERIQAAFEAAPEPKKLVVVDGAAHAQALFETDAGEGVMDEIVRFLNAD